MSHVNRIDIALIALLGAIAFASLAGSLRIANAVLELSERTVLVQCTCR